MERKNLTLDLNKPLTRVQKFQQLNNPVMLQSPDLQMLKLASPELEKMILNTTNPLETPTPGLYKVNNFCCLTLKIQL